jgi:hypothetical protein
MNTQKTVWMKLLRKAKYLVFIPRKVTRRPADASSLVSDLFPIMTGGNWSTEFELLDLPSLIKGSYDKTTDHEAEFYFFDENGNLLGKQLINAGTTPRFTLDISALVSDTFPDAATFAVFHKNISIPNEMGTSLAAERGYTGYRIRQLPAKGYVHGNLDAIALSSDGLHNIGNQGVLNRYYNLQHLLRGQAEYIFAITNPTSKKVKIKIELKSGKDKYRILDEFRIPTGGVRFFKHSVQEMETAQLRILSKLYLARPVVIRVTKHSMDIFHG